MYFYLASFLDSKYSNNVFLFTTKRKKSNSVHETKYLNHHLIYSKNALIFKQNK